jgi:antagonist of KipI
MSHLHVIRPGLQTTVQDLGRWGWQSSGVPVAGPMDPCAHRLANALVGNARDAATLEIALLGPELEFEDARVVAVSGAAFSVTIDGDSVPHGVAWPVTPGRRLRFGARSHGTRAYLAVSGGIETPAVLGSRATHVVARMGGLTGRALAAGDRVPLGRARLPVTRREGDPELLPAAIDSVGAVRGGRARVRVVRGPQLEWFTHAAFDLLQSADYTISIQSDRMGFRLQGPVVPHARSGDMISDATVLGALQVPRSGEPILLMADRQTTGGYPAIASVISADIGIAGQLGPGDAIAFTACEVAEAVAARRAQEHALRSFESSIQP